MTNHVRAFAFVAISLLGLPVQAGLTIQFGGNADIIDPNDPDFDVNFLSQIGASQVVQWNGVNSAGGSFGASGSLSNQGVGATLTSLGAENLVLTSQAIGSTDPVATFQTFANGSPNILGVKEGGDDAKFQSGSNESWTFDFNQDVVLKQLVFSALDFPLETIELTLGAGSPVSFNRSDASMAPVTYGPTANRYVYTLPGGGASLSAGDDVTLASLQGAWGLQGVVAQVAAPVTTLVGGSINNGDFNADSGGTSPAFELSFANTTAWQNVGGSGSQDNRATRDSDPKLDGTRNAIFDDDLQIVHAVDTGHIIAAGDVYNLSYFWTDGPDFANWSDPNDKVRVRIYTTPDDTINNPVKTVLAESLSGTSVFNNFYQREIASGFYTAGAAEAGKKLFVNFTGVDGDNDPGAPKGVARLDNFELSVGTTDNAAAPSNPTGVVLFQDTFDRPDTTGLSVDTATTGMSSDVFTPTVGTTYAEFRNRDTNTAEIIISGNKLQMGPFADGNAGIDRNFVDQEILDAGGFAVEVIVDPKTGSNGDNTDRYATIGVGLDPNSATQQATGTGPDLFSSDGDVQIPEQAAFAFLLYDDGTYGFFDSFALTDVSEGNPPGDANKDIFGKEYVTESVDGKQDFLSQLGQTAVLQDEYKVRLEYEVTDFDSGSDVVVTAFIDDIQIDLDTSDGIEALPGDRDSYTFTWDFTDQNYIALNGRAQTSVSFDNLLIETLPSTGLAGDFDGNGRVDGLDFLEWQRNLAVGKLADWETNYGASSTTANAASVPEPSSCVIFVVLVSGLTLVRRV